MFNHTFEEMYFFQLIGPSALAAMITCLTWICIPANITTRWAPPGGYDKDHQISLAHTQVTMTVEEGKNPADLHPNTGNSTYHSSQPVDPAKWLSGWPFPCSRDSIERYTAYYTTEPPKIDGQPDEKVWREAPRSPRFVDLVSGEETIHNTHAAVLWDDENLYVAFWLEEPFVQGSLTERNDPLYNENNAEVFIAGEDAYYEFEINALGTRYEAFFIWEEAYEGGGFDTNPAFQRSNPLVKKFNGVGFDSHPRGMRLGSWDFYFPGLQSEVHVDGTLNDNSDRDRGWTVELAFPWHGMEWLAKADQRSLPPEDRDVWRIDFSRFNPYREAPPSSDSGGWTWSSHGVWDSHIPECFPKITFSSTSL